MLYDPTVKWVLEDHAGVFSMFHIFKNSDVQTQTNSVSVRLSVLSDFLSVFLWFGLFCCVLLRLGLGLLIFKYDLHTTT